jgi:hypothetical protein
MYFLVDFVFYLIDYAPGLPRRTRDVAGRLKPGVRALLVGLGAACALYGAAVIRDAFRGFDAGTFGFVLAGVIGLAGGAVLTGGVGCTIHALRNPAPPPLPDNVIPFRRPQAARREDRSRPAER